MDKGRKHKTTGYGDEIPHGSLSPNMERILPSVTKRILARRSEERGENPEKTSKNSGHSF